MRYLNVCLCTILTAMLVSSCRDNSVVPESGDPKDVRSIEWPVASSASQQLRLKQCRPCIVIDIKPDDYPNAVNVRSKGVIPVVLLGSSCFDVALVDETTLRFGPAGAPIAHKHAHFDDINRDGYVDLLSHYRTQLTGITGGDCVVCLTGETLLGLSFETCDDIGEPQQDIVAPAAVNDLRVRAPTSRTLALVWTAPGDDGNIGTAAAYDVRLSKSPITEQNWNEATQLDPSIVPFPKPGGQIETIVVGGLDSGTQYYFVIQAFDEANNGSGLSNCADGSTLFETIPPSDVGNLTATAIDETSFELTWTAPGDDGHSGTASMYDIRYSNEPIDDETDWSQATPVDDTPSPLASGEIEVFTASAIPANTSLFFVLKTADELDNWSGLSNIAPGMAIDDLLWVSPTDLELGENMYITFRASPSVHTRVSLVSWMAGTSCGDGVIKDLFLENVPGGIYTITWDFFDANTGQYLPSDNYKLSLCWGSDMKEWCWILWSQ